MEKFSDARKAIFRIALVESNLRVTEAFRLEVSSDGGDTWAACVTKNGITLKENISERPVVMVEIPVINPYCKIVGSKINTESFSVDDQSSTVVKDMLIQSSEQLDHLNEEYVGYRRDIGSVGESEEFAKGDS